MPGPAGPQPRYCYRHPQTQTYVSCTRCDRPICAECMRPAPVGFQCPDDVAESARATRSPRSAFGSRLGPDRPLATPVLVGVNILAFVLQGVPLSPRAAAANQFTLDFQTYNLAVADGEVYRLLTAAFLHAGLLHIALNMIVLYLVGPTLERELGVGRFLALYLLSAIGGNVLGYVAGGLQHAALGASGAVYGLFAAYYVIARRRGADTSQIVTIIGINFVLTLVVGLDLLGHLGGLLTGAAVTAGLVAVPARRPTLHWAVVAGVAALLAVAVTLRTSALT